MLSCNDRPFNGTPSYEEGNLAYMTKCGTCHSAQPAGTFARPTLLEMVAFDSATLQRKLVSVKKDSINHQILFDRLPDSTISDIVFFLKHFNRRQY